MKVLITFLFFCFALPIYSQTEKQLQEDYVIGIVNDSTNEPWLGPVTQEAKFKSNGKLAYFINDSLSKEVKKFIADREIKGKLFCSIMVDKNGKVKDVQIEKGSLGPYIDNEIKRVLWLTTWVPASYNNKPVFRKAMIPIVF